MKQHLIGFAGRAGSGKDTAAEVLMLEYGFSKTGFAVAVKSACTEIFGFTYEQMYGSQAAKNTPDPWWGFSPRSAMQALGDTLRDHLEPDVWVRALERRLPSMPGFGVCVTDVRYPNEADMIRRHGGVLVRVDRPTSLTGNEALHRSERAMDDYSAWDFVIDNRGDLAALREEVRRIAGRCGYNALGEDHVSR